MAFSNMRPTLLLLLLACAAKLNCAQDESAEASPSAPAEIVLPLPDINVCNPSTFHHFTTHYRSCAKSFYTRKDPDLDCCEGLAMYYGVNSTRPSRNCFCHASVWTEFMVHSEKHYYSFDKAFLYCSSKGFIIPFNAEEGEGYCYGVPPDDETLQGASMEVLADAYIVGTKDYVKSLYKDHLVSFAFASTVVSGVGVALLVWPLVWEAAMTIKGAVARSG